MVRDYFSTGPDPMTVEDAQFIEEVDMGAHMDTVYVWFDNEIVLAFGKDHPADDPNRHINFDARQSPLTIGGEPPFDVRFVWLRKPTAGAADVEVRVVGY